MFSFLAMMRCLTGMKTVAVIPSRYHSSRFEGKPLALIAGKPMIQRVYESAQLAQKIDQVIVATDDDRIFEAVKGFDGQVLMTSAANRSGTDRAAETARRLNLEQNDLVINVQGDQPLVDPRCLDEVIQPLLDQTELGMSTLAYRIVDEREYFNPKDVKVTFDQNGNALYFSRAPIPFVREQGQAFDSYKHLGVYAYTCNFLQIFSRLPVSRLEEIEKLEQLRVLEFGYRIRVVVTRHDSPEVDLPEDISRIEQALERLRQKSFI
jgi:3-deoxy-manno-octulosonate cytidylyltransferase (CMP-KDO synthetase)